MEVMDHLLPSLSALKVCYNVQGTYFHTVSNIPFIDIATSGRNLPFITMNTLLDVQETVFDSADEGLDGPFSLDIGFPFGSSNQTDVYVSYLTSLLDIYIILINLVIGVHKRTPFIRLSIWQLL